MRACMHAWPSARSSKMMMRNKSFRSVLSCLFKLGSNRRPQRISAPWHDRKIAAATSIAAGAAYAAARVMYGETEPFAGRTHLALLSHQEARKRDEARFAEYKKKHAGNILGRSHPDTVCVGGIAHKITHAAHHGLAIRQFYSAPSRRRRCGRQDGLQWMDGLDWEVVVLRDDDPNAECFPAAGKIVVNTGTLLHSENDAEIAVTVAHEVAHVVARHSSGIIYLLDLENMPSCILLIFLLLFLPVILPYKRRCELEADHIGILLLAAAGVDPTIAILVRQKKAKIRRESKFTECLSYVSTHPSSKKRCQFLSQPKVMDKALELHKRVTSHHTRLFKYDM